MVDTCTRRSASAPSKRPPQNIEPSASAFPGAAPVFLDERSRLLLASLALASEARLSSESLPRRPMNWELPAYVSRRMELSPLRPPERSPINIRKSAVAMQDQEASVVVLSPHSSLPSSPEAERRADEPTLSPRSMRASVLASALSPGVLSPLLPSMAHDRLLSLGEQLRASLVAEEAVCDEALRHAPPPRVLGHALIHAARLAHR